MNKPSMAENGSVRVIGSHLKHCVVNTREDIPVEPSKDDLLKSILDRINPIANVDCIGLNFDHLHKRRAVDIEFKQLTYSVSEGRKKGRKTILKCVSGKFLSGQLSAILGPSGAGKTSLMNVLTGYRTNSVSGEILVNNTERDLRKFRRQCCYIMQESHLLPNLSVHESMMCAANLKLSTSLGLGKKLAIVEEILVALGLVECQHTRTKRLSGGQRKRLTIALELVDNPPIMFFDEPTSGLDSSSCFQCVALLNSLAQGGRTIICTIHQPSAKLFEMFHYLYVMAEGQCIYEGSTPKLLPYLSHCGLDCPPNHNPADYAIEIACGEYGDILPQLVILNNTSDFYRQKNNVQQQTSVEFTHSTTGYNFAPTDLPGGCLQNNFSVEYESTLAIRETSILDDDVISTNNTCTAPTSNGLQTYYKISVHDLNDDCRFKNEEVKDYTYATSSLTQFRVLFVRTFISILRDAYLTILRIVIHVVVGLLMGLLYLQIGNDAGKSYSNVAFLFFSMLFLMFTSIMPTVLTFPMEMSVFVREHLNYWYSVKMYFLAKTLADLPFQIVFSLIYGCIVYWMTTQPPDASRFLMFLILAVMTSFVSQSLGLVIGAGCSVQVSVFLGPALSIPILLFSGFFVTFDAMPSYLRWLSYLSYIRYSFEGVLQTIYGLDRPPLNCDERVPLNCVLRNPENILNQFDVENAVFSIDVIVLCVFFVVFRLFCLCVLKWRVKVR